MRAAGPSASGPVLFGVPVDFVLFGLVLLGVALFHRYTLRVALCGLVVITLYKLRFAGFRTGPGIDGLLGLLAHEWVILANLLGLLVGFALLADHFERSHVPLVLPRFLPDGWLGALGLLVMVFVLSSFLDNIAGALIGGTIASAVFRGKVHIGYLAAIVAASNAGGAGSVVGDTTTTMMWIAGVSPMAVLHAFVPAVAALVVFGLPAARLQHAYSPITADPPPGVKLDWARLGIVALMLVAAVSANILVNSRYPAIAGGFPFLGATVWVVLMLSTPLRAPAWRLVPEALKGSIFLLALVTCAALMPVEKLPPASWQSAFGLGFLSSVFDNIPLTALAIKQGGYDWGVLAYTVGFGGSMVWFGSSSGVAISNMFPEARSVGRWLRQSWFIPVAYVVGFFVLLGTLGWHPTPRRTDGRTLGHTAYCPPAVPRPEVAAGVSAGRSDLLDKWGRPLRRNPGRPAGAPAATTSSWGDPSEIEPDEVVVGSLLGEPGALGI